MLTTDLSAAIFPICGAGLNGVAGGTGDATEEDGEYALHRGYMSAEIIVAVEATLADGETVTIIGNAQDATDAAGTGVADFGDVPTAVVLTSVGGTTEFGVLRIPINLRTARGFIRGQFTVTHSAGSIDTFRAAMVYVLGGADVEPAAAPA